MFEESVLLAVKMIAKLSDSALKFPIISFESSEVTQISIREQQLLLLKELSEAGIDPNLFDLLLSSELDRNLKKQFGVAFFVATIFFTAASYSVIILNSILKWGISEVSISMLIVETPLQFIGLLFIIARNLFPQRAQNADSSKNDLHRSAPDVRVGRVPAKRQASEREANFATAAASISRSLSGRQKSKAKRVVPQDDGEAGS